MNTEHLEKMEKSAKDFVDKPTALNHTKFIQAANPAAILSMTDEIKSQKAEIARLREALEAYVKAYDENPHLGPRGSQVDQAFTKARAALNKE